MTHPRLLPALLRLVLLASLVLACLHPASRPASAETITPPPPGWVFSTVDSPTSQSIHGFALDSSGRPHAAYSRGQIGLSYRYYDGTAWQNVWDTGGPVSFISLALDASDRPHLVYAKEDAGSIYLYYARKVAGVWTSTKISTLANSGSYNALAIDDQGQPHVAFFSPADNALMYAFYDGSVWHIQSVQAVTGANYVSNISIQLDDRDLARLAYCYGASLGVCSTLSYSVYNGSSWSMTKVYTGSAGYSASLDLDASGNPYIAHGALGTGLLYSYKDVSGWHTTTVEAGGVGRYASLHQGLDGRPRIAYYNQTSLDLKYAVHNGASWQISTLDSDGDVGAYANMALDGQGNPHLAYFDITNSAVKYAGMPPLPDLVIGDVWAGEDGSLKAAVLNSGVRPVNQLAMVDLYVDGSYVQTSSTTGPLAPGDSEVVTALSPWTCSGAQDEVQVCTYVDALDESNPEINCLVKTLACPVTALAITNGPTPSGVGTDTMTISWTTNLPSDSRVFHRFRAGSTPNGSQMSDQVTNHSITLNNLTPNKLYEIFVRSVDAGGQQVESGLIHVRTQALPGTPPSPADFKMEKRDPRKDVYTLRAQFADTSNIQKVTYLVDGQVAGSVFTPKDGGYDFPMIASERWSSRSSFFTLHNIQVQVLATDGSVTNFPYAYTPTQELKRVEAAFHSPQEAQVVYIAGASVPAGTNLSVKVYATEFEWSCDWAEGSDYTCVGCPPALTP